MAFGFIGKYHDKALAQTFNQRPKKDRTPGRRQKVLDGIDATLAHLANNEEKPKRGWYTIKNGVAHAKVKHGNKVITIDGESEFYIPRERAADFYKEVRGAVETSQLDQAIGDAVEVNTAAPRKRRSRGQVEGLRADGKAKPKQIRNGK